MPISFLGRCRDLAHAHTHRHTHTFVGVWLSIYTADMIKIENCHDGSVHCWPLHLSDAFLVDDLTSNSVVDFMPARVKTAAPACQNTSW